jgi:hypothetical protein
MPLAVDNLSKNSTMEQIRMAISETIKKLMEEEGKSQKEAAGQAYGMAREKTGKELDFGR